MIFLVYIYILLGIDYRGLQGSLIGLSKLVPFEVPHYTTIFRRVSKLKIELEKTLLEYKGKDVVISLDSTGVKVTDAEMDSPQMESEDGLKFMRQWIIKISRLLHWK